MKHTTKVASLAAVVGIALSACAVPTEADDTTHAEEVVKEQAATSKDKAKSRSKDGSKNTEAVEKETPEYTPSEENAIASAVDYLDYSAFSKKGLIDQLSSEYGEGFSKADATFAVNQIDVDWNVQAAAAAQDYLDYSAFSRQGLIEQLESPFGGQFTHAQAVYGVNQTGL